MKNELRLKLKRTIAKLIGIVLIIIIVYAILKFITIMIGFDQNEKNLTYEEMREEKKNTAIFEGDISEKDKDIFADYIENFYNHCNKKEYEQAYDMISNECKENLFPNIEEFKKDIDQKFDKLKAFDYQNLSNVDNIYVYQFYLFDDVSAYGANTIPDKKIYYLAIIKNKDNDIKISLNGYLNSEKLNYKYSINGMNIDIVRRDIYYDHVDYIFNINNKNKENVVFRYDNARLIVSNSARNYTFNNTKHVLSYIFINSHQEKEIKLSFEKSFDTIRVKENLIKIEDMYLLDAESFNKLMANQISINQLSEFNYTSTNIDLGL